MAHPGHKRVRHLIEGEAFRRILAGEIPATLDEFAVELAEWLNEAYPGVSAVTAAAVEEQIRDTWHRRHDMIRGGA